tara:strand:+ start:426 stop:626 length:201 start_codon:yes stop_codon:yes gene_type:complete
MSHELRVSSAIVGVGLAGCGEAHGRSPLNIFAEATHNALNIESWKVMKGCLFYIISDDIPVLLTIG